MPDRLKNKVALITGGGTGIDRAIAVVFAREGAKGAQELLMKCMALEFAPDHIRVNSICPAWVETEMNRDQLAEMKANPDKIYPPGISYNYLTKTLHPIGRVGTPEDCAWAAVYLASDESTWCTGSSLMIDGGYTCP